MMNNKSETDKLFFNYFEGNLNETEKQKLMNLIHQNPDLEKEFACWAQSFSMKDEHDEDYGLEKLLLKKEPASYPRARYVYIGLILLLSGVCTLFMLKDNEVKTGSVSPSGNKPSEIRKETLQSHFPSGNPPEVRLKKSADKKNKINILQVADATTETNDTGVKITPDSIQKPHEQTIIQNSEKLISAEPVQNLSENQPDTLSAPGRVRLFVPENQAESKSKQQKSEKQKRKFSLKPSKEILPVNPNL
jgi:hypothetical protein